MKAKEGVFVGYGQVGYRVFDPVTKKVKVVRDTKFDEEVFPFKNQSIGVVSDENLEVINDVSMDNGDEMNEE
ncbi:hypothetical protein M8J77_015150 [Diaphorina citri]|nr:hypothetical protein M8J77_015150 [Diaphorina citri]